MYSLKVVFCDFKVNGEQPGFFIRKVAKLRDHFTGEPLPEVEAELFDEISPDSMQLAREVVAQFGNLPDEEAWLLSVHFEVAKDNL